MVPDTIYFMFPDTLFIFTKNKCAVHPKKRGVHTITRGQFVFLSIIVSSLHNHLFNDE